MKFELAIDGSVQSEKDIQRAIDAAAERTARTVAMITPVLYALWDFIHPRQPIDVTPVAPEVKAE